MPAAQRPDRIGRFRVEAVLGRGAMGVIYRAHDPAIDRPVAIKLVRADLLDGEDRADYIARFQREAQAAGRCAHPNIVAIYDFALHEGNPFLAMEFIDGVPLNGLAARPGGFAAEEIVSVGGQLLDGLAAAHALGVVHRDIKPANIMLTPGGRVKITDFGIARVDMSGLTGTGAVIGTPSYMSPEQCRGAPTDGRTDLFSTGGVLYELVTGAKPFRGTSQHEVWHKLLHEDPPDSAALRPDLPAALHATIQRALVKDAAARFQTAGAMAAALRGVPETAADPLATLASDRTVVQGRASLPSPEPVLDGMALTTIERDLARYVGPIAGYLVRSAAGRAGNVEALTAELADKIADSAGRDAFRREMQSQVAASLTRTGTGTGMPGALSDAELARAQAALARFLGPIARILVKRAAPGCSDVPQLWQRMAENLHGVDRAKFLASL